VCDDKDLSGSLLLLMTVSAMQLHRNCQKSIFLFCLSRGPAANAHTFDILSRAHAKGTLHKGIVQPK